MNTSRHPAGQPPIDPLAPPLLTADRRGTGGRIRAELTDFEVEEIAAYEPVGHGEHLFIWLEKRDVGAEFLSRLLARKLGIAPGEVGTAGMKDRKAVTRQWVSLPGRVEPRLSAVDGDGLKVLAASRHLNKLRPGHLRGNRFRVRIRDVDDSALGRAAEILDRVAESGLPNYYGSQRFGRDHATARTGLAMVRGEPTGRLNPFLRKLAISAAQSVVFNQVVGRRLLDGLLRTVLVGDVLMKQPAGGMFVSTEPDVDRPRLERRELVPAGPVFGRKMFAAAAIAAERETAALAELALEARQFVRFGSLAEGTRRPMLVYPEEVTVTADADGLVLTFVLPAGSYATTLLREVMKSDRGGDG